MTLAYGCVLASLLFPYIFTTLAKTGPGFNNADPRAYLNTVSGWRKRAHYIQLNSFEAFPAFAIGVLVALQKGVPAATVNRWALFFVMARIVYAICYLADKPCARSLSWALGMGCTVALFWIS